MVILYEIGKTGNAEQLMADDFTDEVDDMEPFIAENLSLLSEQEEYHLLKKESTLGQTGKRTDILATDDSGRLIIIELKKDYADEKFESQIRDYWRTLKNNPDTVIRFYEKSKSDLQGIVYDQNQDPKVIMIAPEISDEWVQNSSSELNLDISFVEVKRFRKGKQTYISINDKVTKTQRKIKVTTSREDYDWEHYSELWNPKDVEIIKNLDEKINQFKEKEGLDIHQEMRQQYIPYKHGPRNIVFDFSWQGQKIYLRLRKSIKDPKTRIDNKLLDGYSPGWYINNHGQFELEIVRDNVPDFSQLEKPIKLAYSMT